MAFSRNHVAVVGAVLGLTLAACSDDDSSDPTTPSIPAPPAGATAPVQPPPVTTTAEATTPPPSTIRVETTGSASPSTCVARGADEGGNRVRVPGLVDAQLGSREQTSTHATPRRRGRRCDDRTRRTTGASSQRSGDGRAQRSDRSRRPARSEDRRWKPFEFVGRAHTHEHFVTVCDVGNSNRVNAEPDGSIVYVGERRDASRPPLHRSLRLTAAGWRIARDMT